MHTLLYYNFQCAKKIFCKILDFWYIFSSFLYLDHRILECGLACWLVLIPVLTRQNTMTTYKNAQKYIEKNEIWGKYFFSALEIIFNPYLYKEKFWYLLVFSKQSKNNFLFFSQGFTVLHKSTSSQWYRRTREPVKC